jgi:ligand of Numb protein X 3/4
VRSRLFETQLQFGCFRSTLILCPPSEKEDPPKEKEPSETCDACKQQTSCKKKTKSTSKTNSPSSPTTRLGVGISPAHILSDTMYTNVANLQQTMLLQQQLFRQALVQNTVDVASKPTTSFTSPSLSQYQFVSGSQVGGAQLTWSISNFSHLRPTPLNLKPPL